MPPGAFAQARQRLTEVGKGSIAVPCLPARCPQSRLPTPAGAGIEFKFKDRFYPTVLAHGLVEFADTKGKQVCRQLPAQPRQFYCSIRSLRSPCFLHGSCAAG